MKSIFALARVAVVSCLGMLVLELDALSRASTVIPSHGPPSNGPAYAEAAPAVLPPHVEGRARMIHPPSPCNVPAFSQGGPGSPYFVADGVPRAGQPFRVQWSTKPTVPNRLPPWPALLFMSLHLSGPTSLTAFGAPGCHLQVEPDFVMAPTTGSILTQQGGTICLDWTPTQSLVGFEFYAQLVVMAVGVNAVGVLVAPTLHLQVGN